VYGFVLAAMGVVAIMNAVMTFAVVAPLPNAAASIISVAILTVVLTLAVPPERSAAAPVVGAGCVVVTISVMRVKPNAADLPIKTVVRASAAMVTCAVAPLAICVVMIQPAMIVWMKSVVDTEMVLSVIRWGNAVTRADV